MEEELVTPEIVEGMGISQPVFEEVQAIIGRMPTVQELGTLMAMWEANGRQQSLLRWLKGQRHAVERHEYLYSGEDSAHTQIREPRVRECLDTALRLATALPAPRGKGRFSRGENLYMVGNIGTDFLDSEYARRCLHLASAPLRLDSLSEEAEYTGLILDSLLAAGVVASCRPVRQGGLFVALAAGCRASRPKAGFDILTCREVRLDSFLFGEEPGRAVVSLSEQQDDFFLLKMEEARLNCCFLGHTTKGRLLVDDFDYGDIGRYAPSDK